MAWTKPQPFKLAPRHRDVLLAWWAGETAQQTATRLGLSLSTVEWYRKMARERLRAPTMLIAVKRAMRKKLLWNQKPK